MNPPMLEGKLSFCATQQLICAVHCRKPCRMCRPATEYAVFTGGGSTAGSAPLGSVEVIGTTQQLDQVHAHITVQIIVLSDDLLNVALQAATA